MTDPNGWVTNPPNTVVKVINTSQESVNGSLGVVVSYDSSGDRYVVQLTAKPERKSLRRSNLVKASYIENAKASYQILRSDPNLQRQIRQLEQRLGVNVAYLGLAVLLIIVASSYFIGFTKTIMSMSFLMLGLMIIFPDVSQGASLRVIARNFLMRVQTLIRQNVPYVGHKIADSSVLTALFVGFFVFMYAKVLVTPNRPRGGMGGGAKAGVISRDLQEHYYKLGFDDGKAGSDFGTSLSADSPPPKLSVADYESMIQDPIAPPTKSKFSLWSLGSAFYVAKTLYDLGGGPAGWSFARMRANLSMMDPMRMGFLAFSVYRLVAPLLGR